MHPDIISKTYTGGICDTAVTSKPKTKEQTGAELGFTRKDMSRFEKLAENRDMIEKEMEFADKWEAFEWMYKKQLGRRNLTEENKTYLMGKVLETRKKRVGNSSNVRDELGRFQLHQTDGNGERKRGTSGEIAKELGVGSATVERAEKFVKGVDAIRSVNPAAADNGK